MAEDIVIVGAARTPVGAFNGAFGSLPAHELGQVAVKAALERAGIEGKRVSEVVLGQILTAGEGQNPARQASIGAGIPVESPAWTVNQLCGSGLRAVALGYQAILNGDSDVVVAGGQESMSMAPHCQHLRSGVKMGNFEMIDTMIKDGLWDAFNGYHMGNTAENVAKQYQITRTQQDEFAVASQNKAEAAQKAGKFTDEIVPVTIKSRKGDIIVSADEYPRHGATIDAMGKLRAAFEKDGTVTAGNASGINDGAAAVVLMTAAAPSLMPDALAGVTVPSFWKTALSLATWSRVVPWRIYSSWSTTMSPLREATVTGVISSLNLPAFWAASALFCEATANLSWVSRVICHWRATFSAVLPMW